MVRKWDCKHTNYNSDNKDILKLKVSKKGRLVIAIREDKHNNKEKVKITERQAQELFSAMEYVLETGVCMNVRVSDEVIIDVDRVNCFGGYHYTLGIERDSEVGTINFESVHLEEVEFEQVYEQVRHYGMEGELL